jgi:RNA polymerase sigma-70 factor (ECF subfamily)
VRLSSEWVAAWRDERAATSGSVETDERALADVLMAAVAAGAARWPGLALPPETFVRHLARAAGPEPDARAALTRLHAADLYLACACARGLAEAIGLFEDAHLVALGSALAGAVSVSAEEVDEIRQRLRIKLLVGEPARGRPPLVASYGGRGPLAAWVRVAAVREALTLVRDAGIGARATRRAAAEEALSVVPVDPELAVIKDRYRQDFAEAFSGALRGIADRERALLRLHTVAGLSLEKIGAIYKVDRSTVSRWLADARHALLDGTERGLRERLGLAPAEVESMARLLTSQLEIDLPELLRTSGG